MKQLDTILLIDDDPATNFLHKLIIKKQGVAKQIICLQNAEVALEYLEDNAKKGLHYPELILLDINMPGMDGWEFIEVYNEMVKDEEHGKIVIMLTTSADPMDVIKAENENIISEFMNKPLSAEDIQRIVEHYSFPTPS